MMAARRTRLLEDQFAAPRHVRLHRTGRARLNMLYGVLAFLAVVQAWAVTASWRTNGFHSMMIIGPVILVFGMFLVRSVVTNERELLLTGAVAIGRITEVVTTPKGAMVTFRYQDEQGSWHERTARDTTARLGEGDEAPVFYDPERPGRCSLMPGSFFELI
jgi:hypothetical protein